MAALPGRLRRQFGRRREPRPDPRLDGRGIRPGRERPGGLPARSLRPSARYHRTRTGGDVARVANSSYRARIVRPSRLVAIAALTAALALVALPGLAGSRSSELRRASSTRPRSSRSRSQRTPANIRPRSIAPLDPVAGVRRAASTADAAFVEPGRARNGSSGRRPSGSRRQRPVRLRSRRSTRSAASRRSTTTGRRRCGCRGGRR